jgi:hypothetical protein
MPVAESLLQTFGGLSLPAVADEDTGTAASLDPGRDLLLAFCAAVLNSELGDAWTTVTAALPSGHPFDGTTPVQDTYPDEPSFQANTQRKGAFPMLALHRDGVRTFGGAGMEVEKAEQAWKLHYILGPLDVIDQRKLKDFARAAAPILRLAIRNRKHKAYDDEALQFFDHFGAIDLESDEVGQATFGGDTASTIYWASEMTLKTIEYSGWVEGSEESELEGMDLVAGVGGETEILPDVILAST